MKLLLDQNLSPRLVSTLARRGNCSTAEIREILQNRRDEITQFGNDPDAAFLALS